MIFLNKNLKEWFEITSHGIIHHSKDGQSIIPTEKIDFASIKKIKPLDRGKYLLLTKCGSLYTKERGDIKLQELPKIKDIEVSNLQAIYALGEKGEVFGCGTNSDGQLGLGDDKNRENFERVLELKDKEIIQIAIGGDFALALTKEGQIYSWGGNSNYQLGTKNSKKTLSPQLIEDFTENKICKIMAGSVSSYAIDENGRVYAWGWNQYGQLGLGHQKDVSSPKILPLDNIEDVIPAPKHCFALDKYNNAYSWGGNFNGQLGLGDKKDKNVPKLLIINHNKNIKQIKLAFAYSLMLTKDNTLYISGDMHKKETTEFKQINLEKIGIDKDKGITLF